MRSRSSLRHATRARCGLRHGAAFGAAGRAFRARDRDRCERAAGRAGDAAPSRRVSRRARREASGLPDGSVDLVTAAQAAHWFDLAGLLRRGAAGPAAEGRPRAHHLRNHARSEAELDPVIRHFYWDVVGPYWPPERRHVEEGYRILPVPLRGTRHAGARDRGAMAPRRPPRLCRHVVGRAGRREGPGPRADRRNSDARSMQCGPIPGRSGACASRSRCGSDGFSASCGQGDTVFARRTMCRSRQASIGWIPEEESTSGSDAQAAASHSALRSDSFPLQLCVELV